MIGSTRKGSTLAYAGKAEPVRAPSRRAILFSRALAAAILALSSSCTGKDVAFSWIGPSGEKLAFSSSSSRKDALEGLFGSGSENADPIRYSLGKSILVPSGMDLAIDVELADGEPRASIALSERKDGNPALVEASFPVLGRWVRLYMKVPPGSRITSLTVGSRGPGSFRLAGLSLQGAFSGMERIGEHVSVSSNFRLAIGRETDIGLTDPFAGIGVGRGSGASEASGLLLSYGPAEGAGNAGSAISISATRGDERLELSLRLGPRGGSTVIGSELLGPGIDLIEARSPAGREISRFCAKPMHPLDYELADLGRVLASGMPDEGRDYALYRWDALPKVLVFVFRDYAAQDRYLKRLAFFVEKAGYRGKLHADGVIANLHGWNAHDYRAEDLSAFFRKAAAESFPLNGEERALGRLLEERGVIKGSGAGIEAGEGALISISMETPSSLRRTLLVHESTHAIFFVDEDYRKLVIDSWARVGAEEKWFWTSYFGWAAYDTGNDYLMANEFQAYLLQQPLSSAEEYFARRKAAELLASRPYLAEKLEDYMAKYGKSFEERARAFDLWLSRAYGFSAGRTYRLSAAR